MRKTVRILIPLLGTTFAAAVLAAADPTVHQVYEAAHSGRLAEAQQMIEQVVRDHPQSAKAHYVAAEIYAKEGQIGTAREEFTKAQSIDPSLSFASTQAVQELRRELSGAALATPYRSTQPSFPWGTVLVLVGAAGLLWMVFRRRSAPVYSTSPVPAAPGAAPGYAPYPAAAPAGGLGSGIAGGLASGLAVGAGVVAGEELARHFLHSDQPSGSGGFFPAADAATPENGDMGGSDFGISDSSSWDGGGSLDGGDWS